VSHVTETYIIPNRLELPTIYKSVIFNYYIIRTLIITSRRHTVFDDKDVMTSTVQTKQKEQHSTIISTILVNVDTPKHLERDNVLYSLLQTFFDYFFHKIIYRLKNIFVTFITTMFKVV